MGIGSELGHDRSTRLARASKADTALQYSIHPSERRSRLLPLDRLTAV
jgi:hypothetical protein